MKYAITLKEILSKTLIVEAEDLDEAMAKVSDAYQFGEIVLEYDDYEDWHVEASQRWENGKVPKDADVSYYEHLED